VYYRLNLLWWRYIIRHEPRYKVEEHKSELNFGPENLYIIYDIEAGKYLVEGPQNFIKEFLYTHERMNPWLYRENG
jgi:hypothetical protein